MLTGLLSKGYGYDLGEGKDKNKLIQPNSSNEQGHFELRSVARQNDAFLWGQGLTWKKNVDKYNYLRTAESLQNNKLPILAGIVSLQALMDRTDDMSQIPWIVKDPRMCITLKNWLL